MHHLWRTTSRKSHHSQNEDTTTTGNTTQQPPQVSRSISKHDVAASASQAASDAWLSGHLHHLTPEQEQKLTDFKNLAAEKGYYTPASTSGEEKKPSHDDATMLRFLRARRFDVDAAFGQFKDTEDWRRDNAIDALYENIDVQSYEAARRMYPQWTGRRDHRGIPVYVFQIRDLNSKNMAAYHATMAQNTTAETHKSSTVPAKLLRLFALYENLLRFVMPLCSALPRPHPETPIVASSNIVDVSGVGLKQFWNLKAHMQDASVLATAHYPETLDRIFIIGAPSFFPTVWSWIKRWFDPVTTSKIFILSAAEVKPMLESFMDPSSIPKQYGGQLDWKWGDMPDFDEPTRELVGQLEIPSTSSSHGGAEGEIKTETGTARTKPGFVQGPMTFNGDSIEILGTEDGKKRRRTFPVLAGKKEVNVSTTTPTTNPVEPEKTELTTTTNSESTTTRVDADADAVAVAGTDDLKAAAAAADAAVQPITKPLPTPDETEKVVLENGGAVEEEKEGLLNGNAASSRPTTTTTAAA